MPTEPHDLLIDRYMPRFDATRLEHRVVDGAAPVVYETMRHVDLLSVHSPLTDLAMAVRTVPDRIAGLFGRSARPGGEPESMRLGDLFDSGGEGAALEGWIPLAEERGRELVFGAVGRFWQPDIDWRTIPPESFRDFDEPSWGKIAASVSVRPYGTERSLVTYEARTALNDPDSRRRFTRYWRLVSPFVGAIMRAVLRTIGARTDSGTVASGRSARESVSPGRVDQDDGHEDEVDQHAGPEPDVPEGQHQQH